MLYAAGPSKDFLRFMVVISRDRDVSFPAPQRLTTRNSGGQRFRIEGREERSKYF
jgi:hypothetical protein